MTTPAVDSWYHEKESAWLYRKLAAAESDPKKSSLFLKLSAAAEESLVAQRRIEAADKETFEDYLARYFAN